MPEHRCLIPGDAEASETEALAGRDRALETTCAWQSWRFSRWLPFSKASLLLAAVSALLAVAVTKLMLRPRQAHALRSEESLQLEGKNLKTWGPPLPRTASQHNGIEWPAMTVRGRKPVHFFAVGDWGSLDGAVVPPAPFKRMIQVKGGAAPGPHTFVSRNSCPCPQADLVMCFEVHGGPGCRSDCGYTEGVDNFAQVLVAKQMKARAAKSDPALVLNVGDNFYWGGIPEHCGSVPMWKVSWLAHSMFDTIFNNIYRGYGLDAKPWLSVLGNHDYGGRSFTSAWEMQIAYTWHSDRWVMPAQYYMQHVVFPDQDFTVDIYMLDSNKEEAWTPDVNPAHNICSSKYNHPPADCSGVGGPASPADCPHYFARLWNEQVRWLEQKLKISEADWQIAVTHYPCGTDASWYQRLHDYFGLDLLVTGHLHTQSVLNLGGTFGGLWCIITGGGGGILSESPVVGDESNSYGFFDLSINKSHLSFESINFKGLSLGTWSIAAPVTSTSMPETSSTSRTRRPTTSSASNTPEQGTTMLPFTTTKSATNSASASSEQGTST
eukprot:TRINITY_DN79770_c0_g1_i1.p1 TRINITY_DN79770_c0_g1~~TRINITY_DN79770_c0_g1_i1.p1  ORF type:complete len:551 (-),score=101.54 TRINITY_DN79770_c0_g1_i1:434-2086(-)